jgi:hypothetical protein
MRLNKFAARTNASLNNCAKAEIVIDVQKKWLRCLGWPIRNLRPGAETLMDAVSQLALTVGVESACDSLGVPVPPSIACDHCLGRLRQVCQRGLDQQIQSSPDDTY